MLVNQKPKNLSIFLDPKTLLPMKRPYLLTAGIKQEATLALRYSYRLAACIAISEPIQKRVKFEPYLVFKEVFYSLLNKEYENPF